MAWTYNDYTTLSGADRLTRLQLHISEVSAEITGPNYSVAGRSVDRRVLVEYYDKLKIEEKLMGGQSVRANGRSRVLRVDCLDPVGVD